MKPTHLTTIPSGLRPLPHDRRDLSLGGVFGFPKLVDVPDTDFDVATPQFMKDQGSKDFCTGATVTEVSEDQEGVELSMDFQYAASAKIRGNYSDWGMDLRIAFQSGVDSGSLEMQYVPNSFFTQTRDFLANWENWPAICWQKALERRKASYFKVDGKYDTFDNIRAAMWRFRDEKRTIGVGAAWRDSWIRSTDGVVPDKYEEGGFGHAFKIFGQKVIAGELHLKAQLSNGPIGDNGIYYFKRSVVNREFGVFGQFMYQDMPKDQAIFYQKHGIQADDSLWRKAIKVIKSILKPTYYL